MKARGPNLVSMRNIHVSYESVQALRGVDFDLATGEIHGLLGEHRAGKSTLVKLLSGAVTKEQGTIWFRGQEVQSFTPKSAMQNRIAIVYQNMNVIPQHQRGREHLHRPEADLPHGLPGPRENGAARR